MLFQVEDSKNYYHAEDFEIGQTVDIAGRPILIHDCDGFTKKYFKENYDIGTRKIMIYAGRSNERPTILPRLMFYVLFPHF